MRHSKFGAGHARRSGALKRDNTASALTYRAVRHYCGGGLATTARPINGFILRGLV